MVEVTLKYNDNPYGQYILTGDDLADAQTRVKEIYFVSKTKDGRWVSRSGGEFIFEELTPELIRERLASTLR